MTTKTPPPPKKQSKKGPPPQLENTEKTSNNLNKKSSDEDVFLNFRVPAEFRQEYKEFAVMNQMTQLQVMMESFREYRKNRG